jgi:predicted DNA-binding protein with PD1-like motif
MRYSQAQPGRIFTIRLEDGDILHECIEALARREGVRAGALIALGGADTGSRLVVGPESGRATPIVPMDHYLPEVHEVSGVGTLFPNEQGEPILHMHLALGRNDKGLVGCVRRGVKVWHVLEVILWELTESRAKRRLEAASGFELMQPE